MSDIPVSWNDPNPRPPEPICTRDGEPITVRPEPGGEAQALFMNFPPPLPGVPVSYHYEPHNYHTPDPRIDVLITTLEQYRSTFMSLVDDFRAVSAQLGSVKESFAAGFTAIRDQLAKALADDADQAAQKAALEAIRDELTAKVGSLVDLAAENTPAAPEPTPPPMPEPTPEPAPVPEQPAPPAEPVPPVSEQPAPDAPPPAPTEPAPDAAVPVADPNAPAAPQS